MKTPKEARKFWDERYSNEEFIYGQKPNKFFRQELSKLTAGNLLLPGDGEGRNAVFAAKAGWNVDAFDISTEARSKALNFAESEGVKISYTISSAEDFEIAETQYDAIGLIYFHLSSDIRRNIHRKLIRGLKPTGSIIMEAFSQAQLEYHSGGPKDKDMLYNYRELMKDFDPLTVNIAEQCETIISEGSHHYGKANVIRLVLQKPKKN